MMDFRNNLADSHSNLLNSVFKVLPSMGLILDEDLNIISANDKFIEMFEIDEDIIGKHFSEFFDNYTFINALGTFLKSSEISTTINQRLLLKKEYLHFKIYFTKLSAEEKSVFIWCEDQSKIVKQNVEIDSLKSQMANSTKMALIGEMASGIALEFSSPLMILSNSLKQLKRSIKEDSLDSEGVISKLDFINKSINKLVSLSRNIDLYSKDTDQENVNNVLVSEIINQSLELCGERLKNSDINLIIDHIDPSLNIDCKVSQITQTVINLVSVAEKNIINTDDKWIKVAAFDNGEYVRFEISGTKLTKNNEEIEFNPAAILAKETATSHFGHFYIDNNQLNHVFIFDIPKGLVATAI